MKINRCILIIVVPILILFGCASLDRPRDTVFQVSTIDALMSGLYDGDATIADVIRHGDFGIGTLDKLDGEMVILDGKVYQVTSDGAVHTVPGTMTTPFAAVTFFEPDLSIPVAGTTDYARLRDYVGGRLPTQNIFYAVKIEGTFDMIKVRSVPKQSKPYPPLTDVVKNQPVYTLHNVKGTLVGFVCPAFAKGVNVPGWHLHFISDDRTAGGHLLDFSAHDLTVRLDETPSLSLYLPTDAEFYGLNLSGDKGEDVKRVEK